MDRPADIRGNPAGLTLVLGGSGKTGRRIVQRALGRGPRDFREYVSEAAGRGVWSSAMA